MMKLIIPGIPVSINHMYHSRGKIRFLSKEGKLYKTKVAEIARSTYPDVVSNDKSLEMKMCYYFADNRRRDVTNYDKGPLDALSGILYDDDCQIQRIILEKYIDKLNPRTEIFIADKI